MKCDSEDSRISPLSIAIVGGGSLVGSVLRTSLAGNAEFRVTTLMRHPDEVRGRETIVGVEDYFSPPSGALSGIDVVVNLTGLTGAHSEHEFRDVNVNGPRRLAVLAKQMGVGQFVQLSSLSVYGRARSIGLATPENPISAYGRSKCDADDALRALASEDFAVTLLRVPIIYGSGAGLKLLMLARLMSIARVLPVPRPRNKRSTVHLKNLVAAMLSAIYDRLDGVQFVADSEPFTFDVLANAVSERLHRKVILIDTPVQFFKPLSHIAPALYDSLFADCLIDQDCCVKSSRFPTLSLSEGLADLLQ